MLMEKNYQLYEYPRAYAYFPSGGADYLNLSTSISLDIAGIGKETLQMNGRFTVLRSHPGGPERANMIAEILQMDVRGKGDSVGEILVTTNPLRSSKCAKDAVASTVRAGTFPEQLSYKGTFDVYALVFALDFNLLLFNNEPLRVVAEVDRIPPITQKGDTGEVKVPIFNFNEPREREVGFITRTDKLVGHFVDISYEQRREEFESFQKQLPRLTQQSS